ncbi:phospholipid transport system transporter-binding protein [Pseudoalteromonas undina]|jgi:phospholipid transport system transporter-binding protein|uniref:Anti-sigma B factor antagonist n=1 Tax=Pseudoalteromonas undina TaxID=43660 RepID=A0ABN0NEF0_9GAMM|nr:MULTISPECIES: STAS domain-containing protein [Pseudoalteromonas]KAF7769348.1 phospholipid transport system transporter-binding protein [Pseudoalteromonas undina]KPH90417.1 anti-sigma B factor antagonist [Pseudoalteromonas undina]KPZ63417.1 STAS domain protein [Pseudoalteromonas sp. P1-16-1b]MCK8126421.1 STAS domain-containing protein [Pseudoalteromonas sp. 2CM39R]PWS54376.1 anti-sigma factor antagonist [Pseudoalteromonas sp. meg-B1]
MSKLAISQVDEQHLRVTGELTHNSIGNERLLNTKRQTKHKTLYFDLTEVTRVDTAGLAWLIHSFTEFKQQGIRLELQNPPEQLQNLMQLGQVTTLFE